MSRTREPRPAAAAHEAAHDDVPVATDAHVDRGIHMVETGDIELLASLLRDHPEQRDAMIAIAMRSAGNDTVLRALELVDPKPMAAAPTQAHAAEAGGVDARIHYLEPGDARVLAKMVEVNPEQRERLLDDARRHAGPEIVREALALLAQQSPEAVAAPQEAPPTEAKDKALTVASETEEATPPEAVEKQVEKEAPQVKADAPAPSEAEEKQPGWVLRAREYNREHAGNVETFNTATQNACVDPATGEVDPYKVARWQVENQVPPDGRVGGKTADNAVLSMTWDLDKPAGQDTAKPEP